MSGPTLGGVVHSVRSLLTAPAFDLVAPSEDSVPFDAASGRGIPRVADVYLPAGPGPHPSVVLVHGGGWVIGSRRMKPMRYLAGLLVARGFAVAVGEYRMVFRGGRIAEAVDDVVAMLRWWIGRGSELHLDPDRVAAVGLSAGATTLLLAAEQVPLSQVVSVFGVYDFASMRGGLGGLIAPLLLQGEAERWSPLRRSLPTNRLTLLHGTADTLTPIEDARRAAKDWAAAGVTVELIEYEGLPHAFFNDATSPGCQRATADLLRVLGG